MSPWTSASSSDLYQVPTWAAGFFSIHENGNLQVHPDSPSGPSTDLFELTRTVRRRGIDTPVLLRFPGILRARVRQLTDAFTQAREEFDYPAAYRCVFPIKVNQERWVVEGLLEEGRQHGMGLEVGSKPELIAGIALQAGEGSLLICNGYKDAEYIEMALLSERIGITSVIVIEKLSELDTILRSARLLNLRPRIGVRCKLTSPSSGRWSASTGVRSKFGLTAQEIVTVVETLQNADMLDCLELLHVHIGSQITHIRAVKKAMREATQILANLNSMGAHITWFDAGGGLAVDYDGSGSTGDSSMNYSLQEYANDVVWALAETCREHEIPPPTLLTESGRALVAHHSMLVTEVVGTTGLGGQLPLLDLQESRHELLEEFVDLADGITEDNAVEHYHDAQELRERALQLFNTGHLSLTDKGRAEQLFFQTCQSVQRATRHMEALPEALASLERDLAATYFLNASIFQSLPDSWAIDQLFPILPLHRLAEEPTQGAILADLTCDSDGRVDRFIGTRGPKHVLELHPPIAGQPYYLGIFLLGAYQEILGDIHNLFGNTHVAHVEINADGRPRLVHVQSGERVEDVLSHVKYHGAELRRTVRRHVEHALAMEHMSDEESALFLRRFESSLQGYTYLTRATAKPKVPPPQKTGQSIEDSRSEQS
ncbi:MAG TPA: biosynthetic arginine decarboxylase [Planctomycetes bacterium]|nr:biosynthetic arginine decarboxylase [Planctomycetota bacterium]HIK60836.1 biosynthetic arginine decarboxylase [Planctomycetota bacterium]